MRLRKKVAIVTGGGSGLGAAASIRLAKEGAKVLVADIRHTAAEETAKKISVAGGSAYPFKADVTKADDVESMVMTVIKKFGKLDVMFKGGCRFAQPSNGEKICASKHQG
jgi:NAD(P)-dependent dehydrogenase (short-subunit alcohol dehydrogenase family)